MKVLSLLYFSLQESQGTRYKTMFNIQQILFAATHITSDTTVKGSNIKNFMKHVYIFINHTSFYLRNCFLRFDITIPFNCMLIFFFPRHVNVVLFQLRVHIMNYYKYIYFWGKIIFSLMLAWF